MLLLSALLFVSEKKLVDNFTANIKNETEERLLPHCIARQS
jgi:hypothetical protein